MQKKMKTAKIAERVIKAGDVVVLKSGGPKMTVERVFDNDKGHMAACAWFDPRLFGYQSSDEIDCFDHEESFTVAALQRA